MTTTSTKVVGSEGERDMVNRSEPLQRREFKQAKGAGDPEGRNA